MEASINIEKEDELRGFGIIVSNEKQGILFWKWTITFNLKGGGE